MLNLAYFCNAENLKNTYFFTLIFFIIFHHFLHFEKNSGFSISCTSRRRGDMYGNFMHSNPIFQLWARAPTARALQVELCMFFITFMIVLFIFFSEPQSNSHERRKNLLICQVFFDRGCLRKPYVALTHTRKI